MGKIGGGVDKARPAHPNVPAANGKPVAANAGARTGPEIGAAATTGGLESGRGHN